MRRIGVVVNPIAGMGGRVGLKGTDGKVEEARRRGAEQRAPDRARIALESLAEVGRDVELLTYGDPMGESIAREAGFDPTVVGTPASADETGSEDTQDAVQAFVESDVDAILFVGGDGTAVDVATTLDRLNADIPILGVPAGVKVYSSVFGVSPRAAGRIVARFSETERAEVNDIDEDAFRGGEVVTELRAVATVPIADQRQSAKQLGGGSVESLAESVADAAEPGVTYVLGPGSTVGAIKEQLGFDGTTLGVDVWRDGQLLARDAAESNILDALGDRNVIVVSPIGGQGFVFGRGNQQLSPAVIRKCDLEVVASRRKLDGIGTLRVDTGDPELDEELRGWLRVRVGRHERRLVEVV
ncbi:NAD+ kinase [Haloarcula vallismortis]|uniref:ATP-NAD/AcoX kinase n=2 Tax=Haloarcula vallismortis TaxID=28442 RepID=M0IYF9_HALVA|nr:ATP-NAD kinase family protein [Haloarcula vallismortis]EMA01897.1 ATP-NAD/AcoX kinase [Haloarcula vallismortis ATCC 29715]SDW51660.1 NAD+ kinase [Haloarcula vallismortis]